MVRRALRERETHTPQTMVGMMGPGVWPGCSTPWRHARLMMSKQAWRVVLKGRKNIKGRDKRKNRESERKRGERERLGPQHKNH